MNYPDKGLLVFVFRNGPDCTLNGVTKYADQCVLLCPGLCEIFELTAKSPALYLASFMDRIIALPEAPKLDMLSQNGTHTRNVLKSGAIVRIPVLTYLGGWMVGGNYVSTSDSRFPSGYPIPVYDRKEV